MQSAHSDIPTLLFYNLTVLIKLHGAPKSLKECVERGMFSRPNRTAFEKVVHFLVDAYDHDLCRSSFTAWPIVERTKQERVFRREVVVAIEKIASLESDFCLPTFAASFLSTPGGPRLENFLCRLSALVLQRILERRGHHDLCDYPKGNTERCLAIAKARASAEARALCKEIKSFVGLVAYRAESTRRLNEKLLQTNAALKTARSRLSDLGVIENAGDIFDANVEKSLRDRLKKLQTASTILMEQENRVQRCGNAARAILQDRLVPIILDGGCDQPLDLTDLLRNAVGIVGALSPDFSSSYDAALPELQTMMEDVTAISRLTDKALNGMTQLMDRENVSCGPTAPEPIDGTPVVSERFRGACQLLQEASYRTPPLELRPRCDGAFGSLSSDTDSPPISNVTDLLCAKRPSESIEAGRRLVKTQGTVGSTVSQNLINCRPTPMRPRSRIARGASHSNLPVASTRPGNCSAGAVPKTRTAVTSADRTPAQKLTNGKGPKTPVSTTKGSMILHTPKLVNTSSQQSKKGTISPVADQGPDGPVQEVLDLAASLLSPPSSATVGGKIFPELDREASANDLEPFKFSENMSDSPPKKERPVEPEEIITRKPEARKSLLAVIDRYKMISADFATRETSPSENEALSPDIADIDINLDEEYDSFIKPFELSLEWEKNGL